MDVDIDMGILVLGYIWRWHIHTVSMYIDGYWVRWDLIYDILVFGDGNKTSHFERDFYILAMFGVFLWDG